MPDQQAAELDAAIFDLGGVLTSPILESFADFEQELGLEPGALVTAFREHYAREDGRSDFHQLEIGEITEAEYYKRLGARIGELGGTIPMPEDPVAVRRKLWGRIRRNDEMIEAATAIARHYKVGLLTNNVKEWGGWREFYPTGVFEVVVDSSEVGMRKPDPRIYRLTCERLGVEPGRAAFVDDIEDNVAGARDVGLHGIRFTTTGEVLAQLRPLFPRAFEG